MGFAKVMGWYRGLVLAKPTIIIPNPGWESGDEGGWTLTAGSLGGECSVLSIDPHSGAYHLNLLKNQFGGQSFAYVNLGGYNSIAKLIGRIFTFTVWGKAISVPTTALQLQITYIGSAQGATVATFAYGVNLGVYTKHSVTSVPIPTDATDIRLFVATSSANSGRWRVDDMTAVVQ